MDRYLVISSDSHASGLPDDYKPFIDPKFRAAYDEWVADEELQQRRRAEHTGQTIYGEDALEDFGQVEEVATGGLDGAHDSERRLKENDADGVVAEVIFPGGGGDTIMPFNAGLMTYQYKASPETWLAGCRAYNRWLADFCTQAPGRRAGVGLLTVDDIDITVQEVKAIAEMGLFGGVLIPSGVGDNVLYDLPHYNHPRYEPLWEICEELQMPVHTHSGWTPNFGNYPGSLGIFLYEVPLRAHRPLWMLLWSGVFERHPGLKFVMTEQGSTWIPPALAKMDYHYNLPMFSHLRRTLPLQPSDYFKRQCYVGASFLRPSDSDLRYEIGVDKLMWGSDYPHMEGTWPYTEQSLRESLGHVSEDEVTMIVGATAAHVYNFDVEALTPIANQIGPTITALAAA